MEEQEKLRSSFMTELFLLKTLGRDYLQFNIKRNLQESKDWIILAKKILEYFECKRCTECCRRIPVELDDEEVARLCRLLGIGFEEFERRYLNPGASALYLKIPCPFLEGNRCTVYECRPDPCRTYPFRQGDFCIALCPMGREIEAEIVKKIPFEEVPEELHKIAQQRIDQLNTMMNVRRADTEPTWKIELMQIPTRSLKSFLELLKKERDSTPEPSLPLRP
jgi:Fe-S-cluster containining protein